MICISCLEETVINKDEYIGRLKQANSKLINTVIELRN